MPEDNISQTRTLIRRGQMIVFNPARDATTFEAWQGFETARAGEILHKT